MKKKSIFSIFIILAVMVSFSIARADTVNMEFTGVNGQSSHGYYIDPYYANVNGVSTTIWCIDFNHEVTWGDKWVANVTYAGNIGTVGSDFTYSGLTYPARYHEMLYLISEYNSHPNDKATIQWVIWDISKGTLGAHAYSDLPNYASYLSDALSSNGVNYSIGGWEILTDVQGVKQEFAVYVPEPSTLLLLGFGLVGIGLLRRKQ